MKANTSTKIRLIASALDLCNFGLYATVYNNHYAGIKFKLVNDIDLTGVDFTPIGDSTNYFSGTFDGDGHTIGNLQINSSGNSAGLFGFVGGSGTVKNVKLSKIRINGGDNVGVLVGYNSGAIENCASNGSVSGNERVGGLVGFNNRTIQNCTANDTVTGNEHVGGLVGFNGGTIQNCLANSSVSGVKIFGDFVGINNGCVG